MKDEKLYLVKSEYIPLYRVLGSGIAPVLRLLFDVTADTRPDVSTLNSAQRLAFSALADTQQMHLRKKTRYGLSDRDIPRQITGSRGETEPGQIGHWHLCLTMDGTV
ncbi:MAG: hypothetical protein IJT77_11330 [Clostridia bacterium]|nr:hypothetical protein [Clostridia bacterium]